MSFTPKTKDEMVDAVIAYLTPLLPENTDFSSGEPLRTFIEAIMQEMDYQYWQLQQVYDSGFIDTSYGDDLSELVKILGITREPAKYAKGKVRFYRETEAILNSFIPKGTLVETTPNREGITYKYQTVEDAYLEKGQTEVYVEIIAVLPGKDSNVSSNNIIVINNPPNGIESVTNDEAVSGGMEEETDENLRERAKTLLNDIGLATIESIRNNINKIPGIKSVSVMDMARGIGTVDVLVLGDIIPLGHDKLDEVAQVIERVKAAGIDVVFYEPNIVSVDMDIKIVLKQGTLLTDEIKISIEKAIENYINSLDIGEDVIVNQLNRIILNNSDSIIDVTIETPSSNIIVGDKEIAKTGTINIHE